MTTTPTAPALTMEILHSQGAYRHLTFRPGTPERPATGQVTRE